MARPTLTHIALQVPDVDAVIAFYGDYCGLEVVHERAFAEGSGRRVVWLAEPGRGEEFILVILPHGQVRPEAEDDYSHLGFALDSRQAVDEAAQRAEAEGCLIWPPRDEAYPVGYYCGLRDPAGNKVELSYGQPLGPGAPSRSDEDGGPRAAKTMSSSTSDRSA
ncbi:MAG: VOC family protein [Myxococcota bacterium]